MRKALLLLAAVLTVAGVTGAASARQTASTTVTITSTGFNPDSVSVRPGDTVTWKNSDTADHQVVSDTGVFKSPVLKTGQSWSYTFQTESGYSYHDASTPTMAGDVNVLTTRVSVGITRMRVVYRNPVRVFGSVPSGAAGEQVTIQLTPYGKKTIVKTVTTDAEGAYELTYKPTITTLVRAFWNQTDSARRPTIGVRPLVIFRALNTEQNRFLVRVKADRGYAHKVVRINRKSRNGVWKTTRIVRLNRFSQARFTANFPRGTTKAQAWVTRHPGYQPGFSVIKLVSR